MGLFRRSRPAPAAPLPLVLPRRDGSTWPAGSARPSFEASTYYEMGSRRAYEPEAHALADRLLEAVEPGLRTGASGEDAPYLRKVLLTAARIGVGLGLVERGSSAAGELDPSIAGALGQARRGLPAMQPDWALLGAWFLLAGHYLARQEQAACDEVVRALVSEVAG